MGAASAYSVLVSRGLPVDSDTTRVVTTYRHRAG
jgi:hypothetical protein